MADTKITALTAITTVDPAVDVLPIVDVSDTTMAASGTTKKITSNQILGAGGTATLASATITGDLTVDTSTLKVDSANNRVGIGTASPSYDLEIAGAVRSSLAIRGNFAGGTDIAHLRFINANGSIVGDIYAQNTNGGASDSAFLAFNTVSSGTSAERYRIASDGVATWSNVGGVAGTAMTLNSTGLGVGVVPSAARLEVGGQDGTQFYIRSTGTTPSKIRGFTNAAEAGVIGFLNGGGIYFDISGERMRIDSSGNVGIGVTPSAWQSSIYKVLEFSRGVSLSGQTDSASMELTCNAYIDSGFLWTYKTTAAATHYRQFSGQHQWHNAPSGTAGTAITFTQAMTLTSDSRLQLNHATLPVFDFYTGATLRASIKGTSSELNINSLTSNPITFTVDTTERMRLDASGRLLVNTASVIGGSGDTLQIAGKTTAGTDYCSMYTGTSTTVYGARYYHTSAVVGSITFTALGTAYNIASDYRLKEAVAPLTGGLARVSALKPSIYKWKVNGSDGEGFIAHELAEVIPAAVTGHKDAVNEDGSIQPQQVDLSKIVPVLVAAIQELTARVQTLETR